MNWAKQRAAIETDLAREYAKTGRAAEIGHSAQWFRELHRAYEAANVLDAGEDTGHAAELNEKRQAVRRDLENSWAADPDKRKYLNGARFQKALREKYQGEGISTAQDTPKTSGAGWGVARLVGAVGASASTGAQFGGVVGNIAHGLTQAVTGAAQMFVNVGETILGLVLSPFGRAGAFAARIGGTIANALVSGVTAVGNIAAAGLKIGAALAGGIVGGLGAVVGAGIGALVGGLLLPGVGALGGAIAGAGVFAALGGAVMSVVSQIGGAIGQTLGAVGTAMGSVGKSITDTLGNVQGVLSDLISTGKDFAAAAFSVQRGTGQSLGSAGGVVSLSKILTGSAGGLGGVFSGFGNLYMGQKAQAFGINAGNDPLSILGKAQGTFNRYGGGVEGSIRRGEMMQVLFGGNQDIANLLSSGMAGKAVSYARATAPSAKEMRQDFAVSMDLSLVGRQLDMIKMKFLTDLMPVIKLGVGMFGSFINKNMGGIIGGLKAAGEWLFVQFPAMLGRGINLLFEFGKSFALAIPQIAQFGSAIFGLLAGMGNALKPFAGVLITIGAALGAIPRKDARSALEGIRGMPNIDPHALDPMFEKAASMGPSAYMAVNNAQVGFNKYYGGATGTEAARQKAWDKGMGTGGGGGAVKVQNTVNLKVEDNPHALYRLKGTITDHVAQQFIRAESRAGGG